MVVGVTNEPESLVTKTMDKNRMHYPVAMVKTPDEQKYGIKGFPTAFLLDVDGTILWTGHPGLFDQDFGTERLEQALERTAVFPTLPDEYDDVTELAADGELRRAWSKATRELQHAPDDAALKTFVEALETRVKADADAARKLEEDGEYGRALDGYAHLLEVAEDMPGTEDLADRIKALKRDKDAKDELDAHKKLVSALDDWRDGDFEKALKSLASLGSKAGETPSGRRAAEIAARHDT